MNIHNSTTAGKNGRTPELEAERELLAARVGEVVAVNRWTKAEAARRSGIPESSFHQWLSGDYSGRLDKLNEKARNWLAAQEDMTQVSAAIPMPPAYVALNVHAQLTDMLTAAQIVPAMVMATVGAGMGKTYTARRYVATHPNSWLTTMTAYTRTVHGVLQAVARSVGLKNVSNAEIVYAIGDRLEKRDAPTLLVIDEAQWLGDDSLNQLRHFSDDYGCGLALLGNKAFYRRFADWTNADQGAQLQSRAFKRLDLERLSLEDARAYVAAWGVEDPGEAEYLTGLALKPGALRGLNFTIQLARMSAAGAGREVTLADYRTAYKNRDVEDAR